MKQGSVALLLVMALGCRSSEVRKEEEDVSLKPRSAKPFEMRKKIAVIDFEDKSAYGPGRLGRPAADVLMTFLYDSGQFRMIERQQVSKVLDELKFQQSGAVDAATAQKVGQILGVDMIVYGAVTNFGIKNEGTEVVVYQQRQQIADATVDVRLINVSSAEVLYMGSGKGTATQTTRGSFGLGGRSSYDETLAGKALRAAIAKFVDNLIDHAP